MNNGSSVRGTPRGRGRSRQPHQQQSWRQVSSPTNSQSPVGVNASSNELISNDLDRKSHGSWQSAGPSPTPVGCHRQRQGASSCGGENFSRGGRTKQWKDCSKVGNDSDIDHDKVEPSSVQLKVGVDASSNEPCMSDDFDRKLHGSWQSAGRGSRGSVLKNHENRTPPAGGHGQRQGWSSYSGESFSRGGKTKQWKDSSKVGNGSDIDKFELLTDQSNLKHENEASKPLCEGASVSSPLNLDKSFIENVDHHLDVSHPPKESSTGYSHPEIKGVESAENVSTNVRLEPLEQFDICPPKPGSFVLKPSLFAKNRENRNDRNRAVNEQKGIILRSGMVLFKKFLSILEQVDILKLCREHGLGPAGFYQPCFREGGKMHLKLMCFGQFWDPETHKYAEVRPMDGAKPPPMPHVFQQLVDRAIKDSHSLIATQYRVRNVEDVLPSVKPDICLVNYYATAGRLGLHQDKDESRESLDKQIPIVSFSIGDSAEFLYGDEGNAEKAEKVTLESGDVLIFGGKSRHIFHGVSKILPNTAPSSLLEETNFRSGRLNLTFRQRF